MKHKMKLMSFLMAALIGCSAMTACGGSVVDDSGAKVDADKTQLYVFCANWGYGTEWFFNSVKEYEALNAEREFEPGKKGIQIIPYTPMDNLSVSQIKGDLTNEVYFLEAVPYHSYLSEDLFADITDCVTKPNPYDNNVMIESKMSAQMKDGLKVDGKYYAIPNYTGSYGLIYNADLFDKYNWYFNTDGEIIGMTDTSNTTKAAGPNGIVGDYDDGLPATYEQFFRLCDAIVEYEITPVCWTGTYYEQHLEGLLNTLVADYEGVENISKRITFKDSEKLASLDQNGKLTLDTNGNVVVDDAATEITNDKGYEVFRQSGIYYGLQFIEKLVKTENYHNKKAFSTYSQRDAQDDFIYAGKDGKTGEIAMLVDGDWWQSEASETFEAAKQYGTKYERNFKYMPLPKATEEKVGERACNIDFDFAYAFVSKSTKANKVPIATDFIQFVYSNDQMVKFTKTTNTIKALNYTMTEADMKELTPYGLSLFNYKKSGRSDTVVLTGSNAKFIKYFARIKEPYIAVFNDLQYGPAQAFKDVSSATAKTYFENMYKYWKGNWN